MIRIALADDHPVIVDGITRWVEGEPDLEVVASANSLDALIPQLDAPAPDVLVLDFRMPGVDGVSTLAALAASGWSVIVFSLLEEPATRRALVGCGVRGFVSKSEPLRHLVDVIRRVASGQTDLPDETAPLLHEQLSERERLVFDLVIKGMTPKEIAYELELTTSSVYTYAQRVRAKLGVESSREVIDYAHAMGLVVDG